VKTEPGCRVLGNVTLDSGVQLMANAVVLGPASIGQNTLIGNNSVVGFLHREELSKLAVEGIQPTYNEGRPFTTIGRNCVIRSNCTIYAGVKLGNRVTLGHNVLIREDVTVDDGSVVGTNTVIDGHSRVGARVSMQTGVYIPAYTTVEDDVFLGPHAVLTNDKFMSRAPYKLKGPTISRKASVGANAIIMPGITVGENAMVAAGAVVTQNVKKKAVVAGVPAREIKRKH